MEVTRLWECFAQQIVCEGRPISMSSCWQMFAVFLYLPSVKWCTDVLYCICQMIHRCYQIVRRPHIEPSSSSCWCHIHVFVFSSISEHLQSGPICYATTKSAQLLPYSDSDKSASCENCHRSCHLWDHHREISAAADSFQLNAAAIFAIFAKCHFLYLPQV